MFTETINGLTHPVTKYINIVVRYVPFEKYKGVRKTRQFLDVDVGDARKELFRPDKLEVEQKKDSETDFTMDMVRNRSRKIRR